jgi:DNA repair exonuclease SbcCD ATPase subunit
MISNPQYPLWDPISALSIINPDKNTQTCLGYAPSQGRRCRNAILASTRVSIKKTLDELSYLHPSDPKVMKKLRKIVGPGLCWRHTGDVEDVLMEWRQVLREVEVESESEDSDSDESEVDVKPQRFVRSASSKTRAGAKERSLSDAEEELRKIRDLYTEIRERLDREKREREEREERDAVVSQMLSAFIRDKREEERKSREEEEKRQEKIRLEKERLEKEQLEKERLEKERLERERLQKQRLENERLEKERLAKAQQEKERLEKERLEKERLQREQDQKERLERERQEKERSEKEKQAKAEQNRQNQERNERIRQRAEKRREEAERLAREKAQKEREEWDARWRAYQEQWTAFKSSTCRDREDILWPVKDDEDVVASNVREFFRKAAPRDADLAKVMKRESLKWHPNCPSSLPRLLRLGEIDVMRVEMICRVLTGLIDECAGKEAGCFE